MQETTSVRIWGKINTCALLVRMQTGAATVEKSMEVPQKIKNRITLQSSNSTIYTKTMKTLIQKGVCTPMFSSALFILAILLNQPKSPSIDEQRRGVIHIQWNIIHP